MSRTCRHIPEATHPNASPALDHGRTVFGLLSSAESRRTSYTSPRIAGTIRSSRSKTIVITRGIPGMGDIGLKRWRATRSDGLDRSRRCTNDPRRVLATRVRSLPLPATADDASWTPIFSFNNSERVHHGSLTQRRIPRRRSGGGWVAWCQKHSYAGDHFAWAKWIAVSLPDQNLHSCHFLLGARSAIALKPQAARSQ